MKLCKHLLISTNRYLLQPASQKMVPDIENNYALKQFYNFLVTKGERMRSEQL
jgi:hypothetical protein